MSITPPIKLDYDGETLHTIEKRKWVLQYLNLHVYKVVCHKTVHGGHHVKIYVREKLNPAEICAIQAILGSDYKRETYNMLRILSKVDNWNVLFKGNEVKKCPSPRL
jgi:hypothetical protein